MTPVAKRNVTEIETYTGQFVDLLDPKPDTIRLADIANGLANTCRFGGQVSKFYSVAEHSVRCSEMAGGATIYRSGVKAPIFKLAALFHDAHEAYTGDITAPLKRTLELMAPGALRGVQNRLDVAIAAHFNLEAADFKHPLVKDYDDAMMFREAAGLKYSHGIGQHWGNDTYYEPLVAYGWSPAEAERRFIECYERLAGGDA